MNFPLILYGIDKVPSAVARTLVAVPVEIAEAIIFTSGIVSDIP